MTTSKTPHTPGPWECDTACQPIIINGPDDEEGRNVICTIEDSECRHGTYQYPTEVAAANARLIAAAPELLEALVAVLADAKRRRYSLADNISEFARAAIAKTTGRAA